MGADRGVLLQADKIPADPFGDAGHCCRAEDHELGSDPVRRMAIDDYNHQVGQLVAELLGLPCVTAVSHLDIEGTKGSPNGRLKRHRSRGFSASRRAHR